MKVSKPNRALIVGSNGGVGRAFVSLLARSNLGKAQTQSFERIFLLDQSPSNPPNFDDPRFSLLPSRPITSSEQLRSLMKDLAITRLLDLSSLDTAECIQVCEELGSDFLNTSVEEWETAEVIPTDAAALNLLKLRESLDCKYSHLIGSGANPGWVNALVQVALQFFGEKTQNPPTLKDLAIRSILITEFDDSEASGANYAENEFPMTWSPRHCIEELVESRAFYTHGEKTVVPMDHSPAERLYSARCGDRTVYGFLVPHEETVTLSRLYPQAEIGFIYQIPNAAETAIREYREKSTLLRPLLLEDRDGLSLLSGRDRLGVLLCSEYLGELWVGFDTQNQRARGWAGNATQLQVAAGVLAGWRQLGEKSGIHFVEDLSAFRLIEDITSVLGPMEVHYDPKAEYRPIGKRVMTS